MLSLGKRGNKNSNLCLLVLFIVGMLIGLFIFLNVQKGCQLTPEINSRSCDVYSNTEQSVKEEIIVAKGMSQFAAPCSNDFECIKVDMPPCGCNAGGKATAILKSKYDVYQKYAKQYSTKVVCAQYISDDPSCSKKVVAACVSNTCVLINLGNK